MNTHALALITFANLHIKKTTFLR